MAITYDNISDLAALLRADGDQLLDASSKLSLSATLLRKLNVSFSKLFKHTHTENTFFHVVNTYSDTWLDLQLVYEFLQKTIALKILPSSTAESAPPTIDLNVFRNLRLLEVHRLSLGVVRGVKSLRTQLQYLTCVRSLGALREVLEWCGADRSQGFVWCELKEAVFSHNNILNLDSSLEFTPCLRTLDLSHNRIENAQALNCLPHLEQLNLSFNRLESAPTFSNSTSNHLNVLILRNNHIEDIQALNTLTKLTELDLANNCLMDHKTLTPLANLPLLQRLNLQGNPLSFHWQHRAITCRYLHENTASNHFFLDKTALSKGECRLVGSLHPSEEEEEEGGLLLERSVDSTLTGSTVVPVGRVGGGNGGRGRRQVEEMGGMQDSGFVAEARPASPSECSIGSATSLDSTIVDDNRSYHGVRYYESDIEVLSNPSQSSIEVLSTPIAHIRYPHSAETTDKSTNVDLSHHRSL